MARKAPATTWGGPESRDRNGINLTTSHNTYIHEHGRAVAVLAWVEKDYLETVFSTVKIMKNTLLWSRVLITCLLCIVLTFDISR